MNTHSSQQAVLIYGRHKKVLKKGKVKVSRYRHTGAKWRGNIADTGRGKLLYAWTWPSASRTQLHRPTYKHNAFSTSAHARSCDKLAQPIL
jgi:hypothetical protein